MNKNNHHIDELFARELGNIEIEPPQSVWQAIEKKLDKKKRIGLIYFRLGLAAGIALLISVSGIYMYNNEILDKNDNTLAVIKESEDTNTLSIEKTAKNQSVKSAKDNTYDNSTSNLSAHSSLQVAALHNRSKPDADITEQLVFIADVRPVALENSENNATVNNNEKNFLIPRSGLIVYHKPYNEPPVPSNQDKLNNESTQPDALYANLEPAAKVNRWSIEGLAAPQYSYRTITSNSEMNTDFNNNESGLVSYSNAIKVNYAASKRFTIQAGVAYSVIGQTLKNIYIQQPASNLGTKYRTMSTASRVNTSLGLINNDTEIPNDDVAPSSLQFTFFNTFGTEKAPKDANDEASVTTKSGNVIQRMQVIEIPVMARYYIVAGKINWHFSGGISTNILIGNDALLKNTSGSEKIGETENLKNMNFAGLIGTGFGYSIKNNIVIMVEPTFKYYLNSISSGDVKVHPYSFGIYTGICYKLK